MIRANSAAILGYRTRSYKTLGIEAWNRCRQELRTHIVETTYLDLLQAARAAGYRLFGSFENDECIGLMGCRVLVDLVHGKNLYIDDLVVTASARSNGVGGKLLRHAKDLATVLGCSQLRLCTGIDNSAGKRFYEKNGWDLKAVVYKSRP